MKSLWALPFLVFSQVEASASQWIKVLDCDGGAAVVDVQDDDRSRVQMVIRNSAIVDYFRRSGFLGSNGNEIIASGYNGQPVHSGQDFRGLSSSEQVSYSDMQRVFVWTDGAGIRIKVESAHMGCPADCRENPYSMQCESLCVGAHVGSRRDVADWYFRDCR
jgi:hypothetical protein